MTNMTRAGALVLLLAACLQTAPAEAQLARTFVSAASGNDANTCDRLTPCRTFAEAHNKTLANGEITVLDPGGYGAVTITKTISIINDGVGEAGTLVSGGATGITISAGASDAVSLRGLTVKGIGFGGGNGIRFNSGKSLTIENCAIRNHDGSGVGLGILFSPNASSSLAVSNTLVADNSATGIAVQPSGSGAVYAVFNRVEAYNNGLNGIAVSGSFSTGTIRVTVTDSVAARNGGTGFAVFSNSAATALMVIRSVAANNVFGLAATFANATLRVGQSAMTGNSFSAFPSSGAILQSYGDNYIDGNGDGDPAPSAIPRK